MNDLPETAPAAPERFDPKKHLLFKHVNLLILLKVAAARLRQKGGLPSEISDILDTEPLPNPRADDGLRETIENLIPFIVPDLPIMAQGMEFLQTAKSPDRITISVNLGPRKKVLCEFTREAAMQIEKDYTELLDKVYGRIKQDKPKLLLPV